VLRTFLPALTAAANPSLLAAVTVMFLLPSPRRLLLGYLLGAYTTSITCGLVIVFVLHDSGAVSTTRRSIGPAEDLALGAIALLIAFVLGTGKDEPVRERRKERKLAKRGDRAKKDPLAARWLGRGSPRVAFAVGAVLTLPGVSYLIGLHRIGEQDLSAVWAVLAVIAFNLIMLVLIEVPLIGYAIAPERTEGAVRDFKAWLARRGRLIAVVGASAVGVLLIVRGLIELLL
jgi:hypothetical protein